MIMSPCGIDCDGCPLKESCGGDCLSIKGKPFYIKDFGIEICPLYDCAVNKKGFKTCGECSDLPCQLFYDWRDPSMSDEAHIQSINDRTEVLKSFAANG